MPTILHYLKKHRGKLTTGLLLLVGTNLLSLSIPQLLKLAVEEMKLGVSLRRVGYYCLAIAAVASGQAILRTLSRLRILGLSRRVSYDLRNRFYDHVQHLSFGFHDLPRLCLKANVLQYRLPLSVAERHVLEAIVQRYWSFRETRKTRGR